MILHERIETAKKLLGSTDLPIIRVAEYSGFLSNERFSVNFKAVVGIPSSTFRKGTRS